MDDSTTSNPTANTNTDENEKADSWFGISDLRKRKQIQDRLAQRARRKRVAESKQKGLSGVGRVSSQNQSLSQSEGSKRSEGDGGTRREIEIGIGVGVGVGVEVTDGGGEDGEDGMGVCGLVDETASSISTAIAFTGDCRPMPTSDPPSFSLASTPATALTPAMASDQSFLPTPSLSVLAALSNNGRILGLLCGTSIPAKSDCRTTAAAIPLSLRPTPVQLSTIHHQWIDRFPFPRMRDSMISLDCLYDEEGFLDDLFNVATFTIARGGVSWDPGAWRIDDGFRARWSLFF